MKKKIGIWIFPLFIIGASLMFTNCKKEVTKKDPVITWANPADITYGMLLSSTQLNATADLSGTFDYTPAIGTKLEVGANQDLNVVFTPSDLVGYNKTTKKVKINVTAPPTVTDADGNVYHTVAIGNQIWTVENLRTTKFNDNTVIPNVTGKVAWYALSTPALCTYNNTNNTDTINMYGRLYNCLAIKTRKLAPTGWHVPTEKEWKTLVDYLYTNGYNYDGTTEYQFIAKALASATGWNFSQVTGAVGNTDYPAKRNTTGFTGLPGGYRSYDGSFNNIGYSCYFGCLQEDSSKFETYESLESSGSSLYTTGGFIGGGYSVRCVKD